ncbi:MAG: aspartyl protease family protein [Phormidesmis sp.]
MDSLSVELNAIEADDTDIMAESSAAADAADEAEAAIAAEKAAEIAAQVTAYQDGINLASSAYNLSQSAVSPDDWGLVASRWQRAVDQLKLINSNSENYSVAQSKIAEYALNAEYATERIASLQAASRAPLPKSVNPLSSNKPRRQPSEPGTASVPSNAQGPQPATTRSRTTVARPNAAVSTARRSASPAPNTAASTVRVPVVRRLHGTPIVRVTFNDAQTYEMILDTGASRTLITRAMANELGIVVNDRMIAATASEAQVTFDLGQMRSISMGGVRLNNAQVSIGDSVDIGLLGNDFLRGYDVTIRDREVELSLAR